MSNFCPTAQLSEAIKEVVEFLGADFNHPDMVCQTQLKVIHTSTEKSLTGLDSIVTDLNSLGNAEKVFFSKVIKAVKIILVMPATNALRERSFSALRRLNDNNSVIKAERSCVKVNVTIY